MVMVLLARSEFENEICDESMEELRTELLQSSAVLSQERAHTHTQDAQLVVSATAHENARLQPQKNFHQVPKPLYWVHVPKCNSGFARSALFLPGMCQNMSNSVRAMLLNESWTYPPIGSLNQVNIWVEDV